jgi:hypothetical protein
MSHLRFCDRSPRSRRTAIHARRRRGFGVAPDTRTARRRAETANPRLIVIRLDFRKIPVSDMLSETRKFSGYGVLGEEN